MSHPVLSLSLSVVLDEEDFHKGGHQQYTQGSRDTGCAIGKNIVSFEICGGGGGKTVKMLRIIEDDLIHTRSKAEFENVELEIRSSSL